jgi:CheY-like chemotaxis protein
MPSERLVSGNILIIDDDLAGAQALADLLDFEGYRTAHAANGLAAIEHARGIYPLHVILLDLNMPVMNGWQFLDERPNHAHLAKVPVVVVTASFPARGCDGVKAILQKPPDIEILLELIRDCCTG